MDERTRMKMEKMAEKFNDDDFAEAISILEEKRKVYNQKLIEMRDKAAAKILLENIGYLIENKNKLSHEFVKQIESLGKQAGLVDEKKVSTDNMGSKKPAAKVENASVN